MRVFSNVKRELVKQQNPGIAFDQIGQWTAQTRTAIRAHMQLISPQTRVDLLLLTAVRLMMSGLLCRQGHLRHVAGKPTLRDSFLPKHLSLLSLLCVCVCVLTFISVCVCFAA